MRLESSKISRWTDRALDLVNLGGIILLSFLCVKLVFLFIGGEAGQSVPKLFSGSPTGPVSIAKGPVVDPSAIPLWNLFGKEGQVDKPAVAAEVDAPETQLQLELQSVFVALSEEKSTAVIAAAGGEAKLYHIGDKVGNATIAAIQHDKVLLNIMGRMEALKFPNPEGAIPGGLGGIAPINGGSISSPGAMGTQATGGGAYGGGYRPSPTGGVAAGMPPASEMAKALKDELSADPAQTLRDMGLELNGGQGYRVSANGNPMFSALGARPGDVIISVNGRTLGNVESDLGLIESVMSEGTLKIEMERNGTRFSTEVPLP